MNAYLKMAYKLALGSQCKQKHGAVLVRGGAVIGYGVNHYVNADTASGTVHAEIAAMHGAKTEGARLYVARVNSYGFARMSRPCSDCMVVIRRNKIRSVTYTEEVTERIDG